MLFSLQATPWSLCYRTSCCCVYENKHALPCTFPRGRRAQVVCWWPFQVCWPVMMTFRISTKTEYDSLYGWIKSDHMRTNLTRKWWTPEIIKATNAEEERETLHRQPRFSQLKCTRSRFSVSTALCIHGLMNPKVWFYKNDRKRSLMKTNQPSE